MVKRALLVIFVSLFCIALVLAAVGIDDTDFEGGPMSRPALAEGVSETYNYAANNGVACDLEWTLSVDNNPPLLATYELCDGNAPCGGGGKTVSQGESDSISTAHSDTATISVECTRIAGCAVGYSLDLDKSNCDAPVPDPTCTDGVQNGDETGVDCGGSCPNACDVDPDPTCNDGIKNGDETGVDCGGSCPACPVDPDEEICDNEVDDDDDGDIDCDDSDCDDDSACESDDDDDDGDGDGSGDGDDGGDGSDDSDKDSEGGKSDKDDNTSRNVLLIALAALGAVIVGLLIVFLFGKGKPPVKIKKPKSI